MDRKNKKVIIRCDGDARIGLGHIYRCLALADEFKRSRSWRVIFTLISGKEGVDLIRQSGYSLKYKTNSVDESIWMDKIIKKELPEALVLDVRTNLFREAVQKWRDAGILVVTIDDGSQRRLASSIAIYPPVPQIHQLTWSGFTGKLKAGWKWVILRKEFSQRLPRLAHKRPQILVTMGGSDPVGMTLKAVRALDLLKKGFNANILLGKGFKHNKELNTLLKRTHCSFKILRDIKNIANLMAKADLAIASFGMTAYELAAVGTPAIYLCLTDDHKESAQVFVDAGMAISLGVYSRVSDEAIAKSANLLLNDKKRRLKMSEVSLKKVDGRGAERIAKIIKAKIEGK